MLRYIASLNPGRVVLWCYLCWYLSIVCLYFNASAALWLSSVGMSIIVGSALVLSTSSTGRSLPGWALFRLYLMPFCVSSYAALTVGRKFVLIFPPTLSANGIALAACGLFLLVHVGAKYLRAQIEARGRGSDRRLEDDMA